MRQFLNSISIIIVFLTITCNNNTNKEIPVETFADLYIELILTNSSNLSVDTLVTHTQDEFIDTLLRSYNVTRKQIKTTIDIYNRDVNKWKLFYQTVIKKLEEIKKIKK